MTHSFLPKIRSGHVTTTVLAVWAAASFSQPRYNGKNSSIGSDHVLDSISQQNSILFASSSRKGDNEEADWTHRYDVAHRKLPSLDRLIHDIARNAQNNRPLVGPSRGHVQSHIAGVMHDARKTLFRLLQHRAQLQHTSEVCLKLVARVPICV